MVRKNPYLTKIRDLREATGEAGLVHKITGKRFGQDRLTAKDMDKLHNASPIHIGKNAYKSRLFYEPNLGSKEEALRIQKEWE